MNRNQWHNLNINLECLLDRLLKCDSVWNRLRVGPADLLGRLETGGLFPITNARL